MNKEKENNKGGLRDVAVIRSVAVVLVVFFHAYCMMYADAHFPNTKEVYYSIYYTWNSVCMWFHMPTFIFISGYLYAYLRRERGKYQHVGNFLWQKFKRLIIPYWVFTCIISLTTASFAWENFWAGAYSHLWFITMLFNCFWLARLLESLHGLGKAWFQFVLLFIFFAFMLLPQSPVAFMGLGGLPRWFFWFLLGWVVYVHREPCLSAIRKWHFAWALPLVYAVGMHYSASPTAGGDLL